MSHDDAKKNKRKEGTRMKLYELANSFNEIFSLLESEDELNFQALEDTLQAIEGDLEQKAGGIAKMIISLQKTAEAFGSESSRLTDKKRSLENKVKWLKDYMMQAMEAISKDKIQTDVGTVCRQKSPAGVSVVNPKDIPQEFWFQPDPELDKGAVLRALKQGVNVLGAELRQGYHLRIR